MIPAWLIGRGQGAFVAIFLLGLGQFSSATAATTLSVTSGTVAPGATSGTLTIAINAQGNENGISFSIAYNPALIQITGATAGSAGGTLNSTSSSERQGKYGFTWSLSSGQSLAAGGATLITVAFTALGADGSSVPITFTNDPIEKLGAATADPLDITSQLQFQSGTISITDPRIDPALTWTPATSINYGTDLSTILNATKTQNAPGNIVYTQNGTPITSATVLGAGSYTLLATFTPDDSNAVKPATKSVTLTVNKVALAIATTSPSIRVGDALPAVSPIYTGFVNGETSANLTTPATAVHTAQNSNTAGTFPITVSGATSSNYTL